MKKNFLKAGVMLTLLSCLFSCKKDTDSQSAKGDFNQNLNTFVKGMPSVEQMAPFSERLVTQPKKSELRNAGYEPSLHFSAMEVKADGKEYEQALQVEEQLLFSDDQEIFYPGALVKAKSVVDGSYLPITVPRKPLKISVSLIGANPSVTVQKPTLSNVREAISSLLSERKFDTPPANLSYSSDEVHDEKHLKIALGANYNGTSTNVKASAGFTYDKQKTRFLVKIQQVFYTMDVDIPEQPSDFFSDEFDYKNAFGNEKPLYISSIKMGRVFILGIETSLTKVEAEAKINAAFLGGKAGLEAETAFKDLAKSSTIRGRVLGGNSTLAGGSVSDISSVKKFLEEGASFSRENPGIPISYKLRELGTNQTFKTIIYSKYVKNDETTKEKIDFLVYSEKSWFQNLFDQTQPSGEWFIERSGISSTPQRQKVDFSYYGKFNNPIIKALEKGEKVAIVVKTNNKEYIFDLPSQEDLIKRAKQVGSKNLHDKSDNSELKLKDRTNTRLLILELENQKVY